MNQIFVSLKEYKDYETKISVSNRISTLWTSICQNATTKILIELRNKPTKLVLVEQRVKQSLHLETYQFKALDSSDELKKYLNEFNIFVECNN